MDIYQQTDGGDDVSGLCEEKSVKKVEEMDVEWQKTKQGGSQWQCSGKKNMSAGQLIERL